MPKFVKVVKGTEQLLMVGDVYQVVIEVNDGVDYKDRPCSGYVLYGMFPYVWDKTRFELISEEEARVLSETANREVKANIIAMLESEQIVGNA